MSNTLSIDASEWRVLFSANIARVNDFINQNATLSAEHLKLLHEHMDRAKLLASAWAAATPQAAPEQAAQAMAEAPADVQTERKKGGWPKGRSRKQAQQVVQ